MDKTRIQGIERMLKGYFAAYNCLTAVPNEVIQKMRGIGAEPTNTTEMLVSKALSNIAMLDPSIDKLSIAEFQLLAAIYDSDETVRHQAEMLAEEKGMTLRTLYRTRLDVLEKIDKTLSAQLSDAEGITVSQCRKGGTDE